jgi:hypothetical protein
MSKKKRDEDSTYVDASGNTIPVNDAWTGMLAVSLLALMIGSGFLLWDYLNHSDLKGIPTFTSKMPEKKEQPVEEKKTPTP